MGNRLLWAVDCGLATSVGNGQWVEVARQQPASERQPAGLSREGKASPGQGRAGPPTARSTSDSWTALPPPRPGDHPTPPSVPAQHCAATTSSSYQPASIRTAGTPCLSPPRSYAQPCSVQHSRSTTAPPWSPHHRGAHQVHRSTTSVQSGKVSRRRAPAGHAGRPLGSTVHSAS